MTAEGGWFYGLVRTPRGVMLAEIYPGTGYGKPFWTWGPALVGAGRRRRRDGVFQMSEFKPDTALGWRHELLGEDPTCPYLERWIFNTGLFAVRVHHFFRSDEDHVHDHPWWFLTIVLRGSYDDWVSCDACGGMGLGPLEECETSPSVWRRHPCTVCGGKKQVIGDRMRPGTIRYRSALHAHRVVTEGVWTLCITGRKSRDWGFHTPLGWMRQRKYFREYQDRSKHEC
jgi:hypothetical protein